MKLIFCLLVCAIVSCYGLRKGDLEKYGPFQMALKSGLIKCNHDRNLNLDVSGIKVYFYNFPKNDILTHPVHEAAKQILAYKELDKSKKFLFFVGGFKSHINKKTENQVRETFRNFPNSYLIIFDHSPYTHDNDGAMKSYSRSVQHVYYIGKAIGDMISELKKGGISPKNMHAIGHSLGSQILGHVGETFTKNTGEKIWRITGLDPAGPCFSNSLINEQIRSGVAEYVEVYHCNAGGLGTTSVLADIDFFVNNKGQFQPNCKVPSLVPGFFGSAKAAKCSHRACVDIWTASVKNPKYYLAWKCDSHKEYKTGSCAKNEVTIGGFWNPGNSTGVFFFTTDGYNIHI